MTGIDKLFGGLRAASSGLAAERVRIDVIADNIANAQTTHTSGGGAYRRRIVSFEPIRQEIAGKTVFAGGVRVSSVTTDYTTPMEMINDPTHPDANSEGMVEFPNVNSVREMADLMTAIRSYEANLKSQEVFSRMAQRALDMVR
jgi:flagellar basal-body rod protein FlgC